MVELQISNLIVGVQFFSHTPTKQKQGVVYLSIYSATIPLSQIDKIRPILANGRKMSRVKSDSGCDILINGGTYTSTGKMDSAFTIDGNVLSKGWSGFGYAIKENRVEWSYLNEYFQYPHFIGAYKDYVKNGVVVKNSTESTKRGRTGLGVSNNSLVVRVVSDNDKNRCSTSSFMQSFVDMGCASAINLDGGGSSQWISPNSTYQDKRNVLWYIGIWLKKDPSIKEPEGDDLKEYINGNTNTNVYENTSWKKKIGTLFPYDKCTQLREGPNYRIVEYDITNTVYKKVGFIKK